MTTNLTALYGLGTGSSGKWKSQTFTSSGIWNKPEGVSVVRVVLAGGGGGGKSYVTYYLSNNKFVTYVKYATDGGNSIFYGDSAIIADGGKSGENGPFSGSGGGLGNGIPRVVRKYIAGLLSGSYEGIGYEFYGNGGGVNGVPSLCGISGGGGGGEFQPRGGTYPTINYTGGHVPGFGKGGSPTIYPPEQYFLNRTSYGGGASYGNGGDGCIVKDPVGSLTAYNVELPSPEYSPTYGGGGGAGGPHGAYYSGTGGGGGEVVDRIIPMTQSTATIIIGAGGTGNEMHHSYGRIAKGADGASGICVIYWQE